MVKIILEYNDKQKINFDLYDTDMKKVGLFRNSEVFSKEEGLVVMYDILPHNIQQGKVYLVKKSFERKIVPEEWKKETYYKLVVASNLIDISVWYYNYKDKAEKVENKKIRNMEIDIKSISGFKLETSKILDKREVDKWG